MPKSNSPALFKTLLATQSLVRGPEASASPGGSKCRIHCHPWRSDPAYSKNQITEVFIYILELEVHRNNILHSWLESLSRSLSLEWDWVLKYLNQSFPRALFQDQPLNYLREPSNAFFTDGKKGVGPDGQVSWTLIPWSSLANSLNDSSTFCTPATCSHSSF
jgi:hypothetical protein